MGFFLRTQRKRKLFPSLKLGMETWQRELHKKYDVFRKKNEVKTPLKWNRLKVGNVCQDPNT